MRCVPPNEIETRRRILWIGKAEIHHFQYGFGNTMHRDAVMAIVALQRRFLRDHNCQLAQKEGGHCQEIWPMKKETRWRNF